MASRKVVVVSSIGVTLLSLLIVTTDGLSIVDREKQLFLSRIASSNLTIHEKKLLTSALRDHDIKNSELLESYFGSASLKRIVWMTECRSGDGQTRWVVVLDEMVKPIADAGIPLLVIVADKNLRVLNWSSVAPFSRGFVSAEVKYTTNACVLQIATRANWCEGIGFYEYTVALDDGTIEQRSQTFEPLREAEKNYDFGTDPKGLHNLLWSYRERRSQERKRRIQEMHY